MSLDDPVSQQWRSLGPPYRDLMADYDESSTYLREVGLKPMVAKLLGDCSTERVLDAGAGEAWLFDKIRCREAFACDVAPARRHPPVVQYDQADVCDLPYVDGYFDTVVSNNMLCYLPDLRTPLREMARVTRTGGRMLVGLVHPHFYRTGEGNDDGTFTVRSELSRSRPMNIMIGNRVGPFRYYYHPYPDYLNSMIEAGWAISHVDDWFYDPEHYAYHFSMGDSVSRSPRVPIFTFFSCTKPL